VKHDRIHELLADYLEGELPAGERKEVKLHLAECAECRGELEFLRRYKKRMSSLAEIPAPEGFLRDVRDRLERLPILRRLAKMLFSPLKVKLPLEAAGLLALAAIIVFVVYPAERTESPLKMADLAVDKSNEKEGAAREGKSASRLAMRNAEEAPAAGKRMKTAVQAKPGEMETYEIALLVTRERPSVSDEKNMALGEADVRIERRKFDDGIASKETEDIAPMEEAKLAMKKEKAPSPKRSDAAGRIDAIAREFGGRVLPGMPDKDSGSYRRIMIEMPARNYRAFTARLGEIGTVRPVEAPSRDVQRRKESIRLEINIESSQ
jgi:hypothetical protein